MISKRFMDVISILFVLLIIFSFVAQNFMFRTNFDGPNNNDTKINPDEFENTSEYFKAVSESRNKEISSFLLKNVLIYGFLQLIGLIYYIFVLLLAIKLHKNNKLSLVNTIFVGIFIPFALIFYLVSLRKPLKQLESEQSNQVIQVNETNNPI